MKKLLIIGLLGLMSTAAFAQNSAVNKANTGITNGKLAEAKELIDQAILHEKTKDKGRTWYVRGLVYNSIISSEDPEIQGLDPDAVQKAIDSFNKVKEIEKEGSNYYTLTEIQEGQLYSNVFNKGASQYEAEEYMDAYQSFKSLTQLNPVDTLGFLYAGYCAEAADEYDMALEMYYDLMKLDDCPKTVYNQTISILEIQKDDLGKAIDVVTDAMERYPDDQAFNKTQIALYIKSDRTDEAMEAIEKTLEIEPENANLWYNLGYLYGEINEFDKSVDAYKKSIETDESYIDSYINLAYTFTQKAKEIRKEAMDMDMDEYREKGAVIEAAADVYYKMALPVLENADKVQPDDQAILESLNGLYVRLKLKDKADATTKRLVALGYWDEN